MSMLFSPVQAGPLTLHTRLVMPPIATAKAEADGRVSQALLDYYEEKTASGLFGLVIVEHSYISQAGKAGENQLSVSEDEHIEGLSRLAQVIKKNGSKAVVQINHAGTVAERKVTGTVPLGPSAVMNPRKGTDLPHALTVEEIAACVDQFRKAAIRVKAAGFDAVEIHSAHGYFLNQFLSPLSNHRTDAYGGSLENRIRIHLEVIEQIRQGVGLDYPLFLRLGAGDYREGGISLEDSVAAAVVFEKAGISLLDISGGFNGYVVPDRNEPGYFSELSQAVKQAVSVPVVLTGGITQPQEAEDLLAAGKADLIGVGRALFKDSQWPQRAAAYFTYQKA